MKKKKNKPFERRSHVDHCAWWSENTHFICPLVAMFLHHKNTCRQMDRFYLPSHSLRHEEQLHATHATHQVNLITVRTDRNGRQKDKHHWMRDSFSLHHSSLSFFFSSSSSQVLLVSFLPSLSILTSSLSPRQTAFDASQQYNECTDRNRGESASTFKMLSLLSSLALPLSLCVQWVS